MKQVILNIDEDKYDFFVELIKNFNFITIGKEEKSKQQLLKQIAKGMQAAIQADKGKLKTRSAKAFLDEL